MINKPKANQVHQNTDVQKSRSHMDLNIKDMNTILKTRSQVYFTKKLTFDLNKYLDLQVNLRIMISSLELRFML